MGSPKIFGYDHGIWSSHFTLDLPIDDVTYNNKIEDVVYYNCDKLPDNVITMHCEVLEKLGLSNTEKIGKKYKKLINGLIEQYERYPNKLAENQAFKLRRKIRDLDKYVTNYLKGKAVYVKITSWPLISGKLYRILEISPYL